MVLDFKKHYEIDTVYVVICFDKSPMIVVTCDRFVMMHDLLREYAEWSGFDLDRLSCMYMGQVILEAH